MDVDDKYACAEVIQSWGLYRDQGKWPQLLATFVPEGQIAISWFSGSFTEFVDRCRKSFDAGQRSKHHILPSVVRVSASGRSQHRPRRRASPPYVFAGYARGGRDQYRHLRAPEDRRCAR